MPVCSISNVQSESDTGKEKIQELNLTGALTLIDLAVPRDIDPCIGELPQTEVYNIDDFQTGTGVSKEQSASIEAAKELVEEEVAEFVSWYECKDMIPEIRELGTMAAQDVSWRMGKTFHEMQFAPEVCHQLADAVEQTAAKSVPEDAVWRAGSCRQRCDA